MMKKETVFALTALFIAGLGVLNANAVHVMKTETTDGVRIELHVMDAEPFYTADQVKANPELEGMLIVGGAQPMAGDADPSPNCHMIVHVYDAQTDKPFTDAKVSMKYQMLDATGAPQGAETNVPVAIMQVIGQGAETTHYGNNVVLPDGTYAVTVVANGKSAVFHIVVASDENGEAHM